MWTLRLWPSRSTFHSSFFTFNFPQGSLFTLHFALFTSRRDHGAIADAARCVGRCSTLRGHMHRAAVSRRAFPVFVQGGICQEALHSSTAVPPCSRPWEGTPTSAALHPTFPSGIQPLPSLSPLEKGAETLLPYKKAGGADIAGDIRTAWCYSMRGSSAMRTWYRCACDAWQPHRCAGIS